MQMTWGFIKCLENEVDELQKKVEMLEKENQALKTKVLSLEIEMGERDAVVISTQDVEPHIVGRFQRDDRKTQVHL